MPAPPIIDPASLDLAHVAYDIDAIRQVNPQRHEMEQLTAIVLMDPEQQLIVAYKDVTDQEFWVRGHIPGRPLMPGVVMCEAVAQAASFLIHHCMDGPPGFIGFGGMDGVRFRGTVSPGDRLLIMGRIASLRRHIAALEGQGFVGQKMVFEGTIIGVPM